MLPLAQKLLKKHYGIEGELKQLQAYASINYLVNSEKGKFIYKIYNDPSEIALVEAENQLLIHLRDSGADQKTPEPIPSLEGEFQVSDSGTDGTIVLRVLSYLEGNFLGNVKRTSTLLSNVGEFLARLDNKLITFKNASYQSRVYEWNIQQLYLAADLLSAIKDAHHQNLVRYLILQYNEHVRPLSHRLRHSIIHNDAHELNLLTYQEEVAGIIDFGDTVYAPLLQELAVALTYCMMDCDDPLVAASHVIKGYHQIIPLKEQELDLLYYFVGARLAISVIMSAHSRQEEPENEYVSISEKPAWALINKLIEIGPVKARHSFYQACGFVLPEHKADLPLNTRHQFISKALSLSYSAPIRMQRAAFQYMYDDKGRSYLDCVNNIFHVGHAHPRIVESSQRQTARLNTNTRYLYDELNTYAEHLLSTFSAPLNKVFFVNSGSAATDLALRLSRNYTGSYKTLIMDHGYHGNTSSGIEVSAYKFNGKGGSGKSPHIEIAPLNSGVGEREDLDRVRTIIQSTDEKFGTFIAESIVGCGGQVPLKPAYAQGIHELIKNQGGVCIADEVQTGFGRVGSHFWAYETLELQPDIVILGKPMGNGHPIAAVVTTSEIAEAFENGMEFFSSFGGNPVSCVIGQAVLDVISEEDLQEHARKVGEYLKQQLTNLQSNTDTIREVRGSGLFLGLELVSDDLPATELARNLTNNLKERGILLSTDGPHNNVIKIKPPMCFNTSDADRVTQEIGGFLTKEQG